MTGLSSISRLKPFGLDNHTGGIASRLAQAEALVASLRRENADLRKRLAEGRPASVFKVDLFEKAMP